MSYLNAKPDSWINYSRNFSANANFVGATYSETTANFIFDNHTFEQDLVVNGTATKTTYTLPEGLDVTAALYLPFKSMELIMTADKAYKRTSTTRAWTEVKPFAGSFPKLSEADVINIFEDSAYVVVKTTAYKFTFTPD